VYKPHTRDEITAMVDAGQMSAAVAAGLDPNERYGIWWFNRRHTVVQPETHEAHPGFRVRA
jgi:hypothetical protein